VPGSTMSALASNQQQNGLRATPRSCWNGRLSVRGVRAGVAFTAACTLLRYHLLCAVAAWAPWVVAGTLLDSACV
jgi:hypothetical protein